MRRANLSNRKVQSPPLSLHFRGETRSSAEALSLAVSSTVPEILEPRLLFTKANWDVKVGPPGAYTGGNTSAPIPRGGSVFAASSEADVIAALRVAGFIPNPNAPYASKPRLNCTSEVEQGAYFDDHDGAGSLTRNQWYVKWHWDFPGSTDPNNFYSGSSQDVYFPLELVTQHNSRHCNCDLNHFSAYIQYREHLCLCGTGVGQDAAAIFSGNTVLAAGDQVGGETSTTAPVYYSDGVVNQSETDLSSSGFGSPWGVTRNWTNSSEATYLPSDWTGASEEYQVYGNSVVENQFARLISTTNSDGNSSIGIATNGNDTFWFDLIGSGPSAAYVPRLASNGSLTTSTNVTGQTQFCWTSTTDDVTQFYGFDGSTPALQHGQMESFTSSNGVTTAVNYTTNATPGGGTPAGLVASAVRRFTDDLGITTVESYLYDYENIGSASSPMWRVRQISLQRQVGSAASDPVQSVRYAYYGDEGFGYLGDLEYAATYDGLYSNTATDLPSVSAVNVDYYRYYTPYTASSTDDFGALRDVVTGANYARMHATVSLVRPTTVWGVARCNRSPTSPTPTTTSVESPAKRWPAPAVPRPAGLGPTNILTSNPATTPLPVRITPRATRSDTTAGRTR